MTKKESINNDINTKPRGQKSDYSWDLSEAEINDAIHQLNTDIKTKNQKSSALKKISFTLTFLNSDLLEQLCVALAVDSTKNYSDMGIALINDVANAYLPISKLIKYIEEYRLREPAQIRLLELSATNPDMRAVLGKYIEQRYLDTSAQIKLIELSATNPDMRAILGKYIEQHYLDTSAEIKLVELSAGNPGMCAILGKFIEQRYLDTSAQIKLVELSAGNPGMCAILGKFIERYSLYEPAQIKLLELSATNPDMRAVLVKYIENRHLYETAEIKLVELSYGNRKMRIVLDLYLEKYPERAKFIRREQEKIKAARQKLSGARRAQDSLMLEIRSSLMNNRQK